MKTTVTQSILFSLMISLFSSSDCSLAQVWARSKTLPRSTLVSLACYVASGIATVIFYHRWGNSKRMEAIAQKHDQTLTEIDRSLTNPDYPPTINFLQTTRKSGWGTTLAAKALAFAGATTKRPMPSSPWPVSQGFAIDLHFAKHAESPDPRTTQVSREAWRKSARTKMDAYLGDSDHPDRYSLNQKGEYKIVALHNRQKATTFKYKIATFASAAATLAAYAIARYTVKK